MIRAGQSTASATVRAITYNLWCRQDIQWQNTAGDTRGNHTQEHWTDVPLIKGCQATMETRWGCISVLLTDVKNAFTLTEPRPALKQTPQSNNECCHNACGVVLISNAAARTTPQVNDRTSQSMNRQFWPVSYFSLSSAFRNLHKPQWPKDAHLPVEDSCFLKTTWKTDH